LVSKDTVSRVWRKIKGDWEAWNARDLSDEVVVRLILDGTVVRVRIDRKATLDVKRSRVWVARLKNSLSVEQPIAGDELRH
jgi:transposase-like protein